MTGPRRIIAVVNGHPRSGKDTFVQLATRQFAMKGWAGRWISSIETVRSMLRNAGVPVDRKSPAERDLMAEVKSAFERYDRFASRQTMAAIEKLLSENPSAHGIGFVFVREPDAIAFMRTILPHGFEWQTIFIDRADAERVTSNAADAGVENFPYSVRVNNHGDLDELRARANEFVELTIRTRF